MEKSHEEEFVDVDYYDKGADIGTIIPEIVTLLET